MSWWNILHPFLHIINATTDAHHGELRELLQAYIGVFEMVLEEQAELWQLDVAHCQQRIITEKEFNFS